jgi:glucosamine 6-phosphate synthetase-like amidotransferase/phosphosugar isomerase protein
MCNMAAYIGNRRAAPLLLDMIERQEGFAGGYYTGIATIDSGKLHWAKVVGDAATLCRETEARDLPGNVGIVHSRSKSGGDREWAHPFVDCKEQLAYVANGALGNFEGKRDADGVGKRLVEEGHRFRSSISPRIGSYPVLPDGSCVHSSDLMCHLIESRIKDCGDPVQAMREAFKLLPAEIAGLAVHLDTPDCVLASRINQPLMIARTGDSTCVATTAFAFHQDECEWISPIPCNATAAVYKDRVEIFPLDPPPARVADILPWSSGREKMLACLADGKGVGVPALKNATTRLWPEDRVPQDYMMVYEILRSMHIEGEIELKTTTVDGVEKGTKVPHFEACLVA